MMRASNLRVEGRVGDCPLLDIGVIMNAESRLLDMRNTADGMTGPAKVTRAANRSDFLPRPSVNLL